VEEGEGGRGPSSRVDTEVQKGDRVAQKPKSWMEKERSITIVISSLERASKTNGKGRRGKKTQLWRGIQEKSEKKAGRGS